AGAGEEPLGALTDLDEDLTQVTRRDVRGHPSQLADDVECHPNPHRYTSRDPDVSIIVVRIERGRYGPNGPPDENAGSGDHSPRATARLDTKQEQAMSHAAFAASRPGPLAVDYQPGVCNIGPAEIARRRRAGHV